MPGELKDAVPVVPLHEWKGAAGRLSKLGGSTGRPDFVVRVPGRVNLIGEHVDYCGYGVFPMAIEQDVFVAVRLVQSGRGSGPPRLILTNTATDQYPPFSCAIKDVREHLSLRRPGESPPWHLYYLCGVLGVLESLGLEGKLEGDTSFEVVVDGRVPPRAGLSSSSALVCAAALTTLVANKGDMTRSDLASLCAQSERHIGTQGGGMDQAIAFLATAGTAQRIEFLPTLSGEKVTLPPSAVFVIANSLVEANKAASDGYNVRVAECRLATWVLAKALGVADFLSLEKVKELQVALGVSLDEMVALVEKHVRKEAYSAAEIAAVLCLPVATLAEKPLMNRIPLENLKLKLYHRITHVLKEAARVAEFHTACCSPSVDLARLGGLMNASHTSLRDLYECSHPRLDELVGLAQGMAYGARLTGAGWGGCMVALCDEGQLAPFLEGLKNKYYSSEGDEGIQKHVFVTQPGAGASILE
ncbi:N-acetylgalactosamine kinase isoform X2 [Folsomia candida]|uniref:N-acetylgalactosamine kinase n=2 Tax=Folsomia candida TaxID=158441 RepID=A0A226DJ23_FOLCA|nr:N-acetylgalactosamine kinase isoform X2 [Folsomia candida]XP_035714321.1 N-acetylgalactosamine kinase isoform X2 [Folsomia candida]XP_035714322.1 N-acetylgalactosamine kinase isoform X2 [Folsomia candida]OXA44186.1 N-acetylgalactosamine kinase [Folsomia candida]